ncbi:MAG: methyltransferase domain-containing protein [Methanomicrobiales archaeon]|nr:methyltransferase domain-containing protein [Methanomicrobiales archaeon]
MQPSTPADPTKMSQEELYRLNIYHETDEVQDKKQLQSLYGQVNEDQDRFIISSVYGKRVLDVGAGYGTLSRRLKEAGLDVTAIEPNPHTRELAKKWNNVDELPYGIYETPFETDTFDTVILRECVEHLDIPAAMKEINRICNRRVLIFQTNLNPLIALARKRIGHEEFNPQKLPYYEKQLADAGFIKQTVIFRDPLAFPLSGGYHARQLVPRYPPAEHAVLWVDHGVTSLMQLTRIARFFCWRFLLIAEK